MIFIVIILSLINIVVLCCCVIEGKKTDMMLENMKEGRIIKKSKKDNSVKHKEA